MVQNVATTNRRILIIFSLIDLESKYLGLVVAILMQQALWRGWLMVEGFVWRYVLYIKYIQSSLTSPKNRNRVPDVHHERLTQQSHVVTSGAEVTRAHRAWVVY